MPVNTRNGIKNQKHFDAFENYEIPYLIGTVEISNMKSQKVLERCSYQFIDERTLLVHAEGIQYRFKYYRFYPAK